MSESFATPLSLDLKFPHWWAALLAALCIIGLVFLLLSPFSWPMRLPAILAWAWLAWWLLAPCCLRRHPRRLVQATWGTGDRWQLLFADGALREARLTDYPGQPGLLLQLTLRDEAGGRHPVLLLPGMLDAAVLRRLRVRLLLHAHRTAPLS